MHVFVSKIMMRMRCPRITRLQHKDGTVSPRHQPTTGERRQCDVEKYSLVRIKLVLEIKFSSFCIYVIRT